jgi:uncharacterized protein (DUF1800 family)
MLKPLPAARWNFQTAAHLLNRAGFGGPPAEIEQLVALGPEGAVNRLVDYEKIPDSTPDPDWAKPDPERMQRLADLRRMTEEERRMAQRQERQLQQQRMMELRGWWLRRMATGPRPLQEKLTLFWHGHFATSFEKVRDAYYMWRQNELFRRLASGSWPQLLTEVGKDPAMLLWLDQAQSRREKPNENFARELMELFALGEGHYTEKDVTEAARALTGWTLDRVAQKFVERDRAHDPGSKTILGRTGNFTGDDVMAIIVAQPQAARFITGKLWHYFAGAMPEAALNDALAAELRAAGMQFKPVLRRMFLCEEFYAPAVIRAQVKSPVQWLVMAIRQLERPLPPPQVCNTLTRSLGQELFQPPNVKGWDGGLAWITTNNLLTRYNEAATLVYGDLGPVRDAMRANPNRPAASDPRLQRRAEERLDRLRLAGVDPEKLFTVDERFKKDELIAALERRFLQAELRESQRKALREFLDARGATDHDDILGAIRLILCTPDYQLT